MGGAGVLCGISQACCRRVLLWLLVCKPNPNLVFGCGVTVTCAGLQLPTAVALMRSILLLYNIVSKTPGNEPRPSSAVVV